MTVIVAPTITEFLGGIAWHGVAWCAGVDPDKHLDLQTLGWDKCTAAMEEAISSDKAEPIFKAAADKFQEVAATGDSPPPGLHRDTTNKARNHNAVNICISFSWIIHLGNCQVGSTNSLQ